MGKKGDMMDGILWAAGLAHEKNEPEQISDYPETEINTLRIFNRTFMLPHAAIPPKHIKGRYEQWVKELQALNDIAGNNKLMTEAMTMAREMYDQLKKRFVISHPLAVRSLLIDAVAEINRTMEKERSFAQQKQEEIPQEVASKENIKSTVRDLKSLFNKDED